MSGTAFWQETSVGKRLPGQKSYEIRNPLWVSGSRNPRYSGRQIVSSLQLENKQLATASAGSEKTPAELASRFVILPPVGCSSGQILSHFQRESVTGLSQPCECGDY